MKLRRRRRLPALLTIPIVGSAMMLAGCSQVLNNPDKVVGNLILKDLNVKVSSVNCPGDIPVKAGHTFVCTVKAGGQTHHVTVEEKSTSGNGAILHLTSAS